jgi:hypothetical protein
METTQDLPLTIADSPVPALAPPPDAVMMQFLFAPLLQQGICIAAKLKLADLVVQPQTATELASLTQTNEDALYRMLRMLASMGIFEVNEQGQFGLTPLANLLKSDNPASLHSFTLMMGEPWLWQNWGELMHCIKTGETAQQKVHGMGSFEFFTLHEEAGAVFNRAMTNFSQSVLAPIVEAYDFSGIGTLVDIAGGHGQILTGIVKANLVIQGILFDLPPVIAGAGELLSREGVQGRIQLVSGDFFESVPASCDGYLMKHILHDWNDAECLRILHNIRAVMPSTGKVLIVEMLVPEGNTPDPSKMLDLQMLIMKGGKERTREEFRQLLAEAGFRITRIVPTRSPVVIIEAVLNIP